LDGALPPADLLPVGRRANAAYRLMRLVAIPIARLLFRFDVQGLGHVPRDQPYIVIANHLGWADWLSLLLLFPVEPRIHFLGDPAGLVKRPVEWFLVRKTGGYVPVDKAHHADQALYRHVYDCLGAGGAIAIFPEGSYGRGEGDPLPFKKGFAHFAIQALVPVVPVGLAGMQRIWVGKRLRIRVGEPIRPDGMTPAELTALAERRVAELIPPYTDPGGRQPLATWLTHLFG
jgi:1-acyl-sn-glycerol-3-phosphate acyltransferase